MAKRPVTFDAEALRSFVNGIELGSFVLAADRLGRSTSAVSAQLKKLEQQAGTELVQKSGRHLILTERGEIMLSYARRILTLNDEASAIMLASTLRGSINLGMQEDFGEALLPALLGTFTRAHPQVQVSASITRNQQLLDGIRHNEFDLAVCWQADDAPLFPSSQSLGRIPLRWIGPENFDLKHYQESGEPVPLLVFEAPCLMRNAATTALDKAGIPWRIAFTSRSLSGIWAAMSAGLGVTVRTDFGRPQTVRILNELPEPGEVGISLHQGQTPPGEAAGYLIQAINDFFAARR
ncbi:LysR substrate-binding domain-containing protein [Rahnella woolbedingensis]|uniref:LysR family transcriptional regulator n=1 Tax=Rahnella woolbedingensis TaxID=1510574 RepID=A0A419NBQ5_9GAMM|nr:LysR substrate-binding domain-containing protein [Rahnella woolbedingensis]RJT45500.1 LysR family transcriptional regulator [Rahnella woolbedingensis]